MVPLSSPPSRRCWGSIVPLATQVSELVQGIQATKLNHHMQRQSESADETVRAGTGLALSPIFWEGKSKGVVFGVRERTVTGSDYSIALAPSQHV